MSCDQKPRNEEGRICEVAWHETVLPFGELDNRCKTPVGGKEMESGEW